MPSEEDSTMTENTSTRSDSFVAYEYTTVDIPPGKASLYSDIYRSLGWIDNGRRDGAESAGHTTLTLKRNRDLADRDLLHHLQLSMEQALHTIARLERSERTRPTAGAAMVGLLGTAFMAGSVFSLLDGLTLLSIVLGTVGIGLWCVAYPTFRVLRSGRRAAVRTQLDREYDVMYENAAHAHHLID